DPPRGLAERAKATIRAPRSEHVLRISEELHRAGIGAAPVLLIGRDRAGGQQIIVCGEAPGLMLTRWMNPAHHFDVTLRRRILHKLGAEIARLHRAGYIHGDLTPYNVFSTGDYQLTVSFIDHEGTQKVSRVSINSTRSRLRNLMQLGHFDIPGVSRTDRLRVFAEYATAMEWSKPTRRKMLNRLTKMIARRRKRDRALRRGLAQPAIIAEQGVARG
ncbi:MAG TPA: lipopolysaccharide kinase InaA family protein, partial [Candidatus Binataceae bacterium]|nr:lipopolysaccharide kinase InaA family protein [Candidatus Binataceae bacterium]